MSARSNPRLIAPRAATKPARLPKQSALLRYFPLWMVLVAIMALALPNILLATINTTARVVRSVPTWLGGLFVPRQQVIAPFFTAEVSYWAQDIARWAEIYNLDPNLLATVIQIESCGHPTVRSYAGAQGLFQVMPFHFAPGEDQLDPETNAMRGANFLNECLGYANGDAGLAMACYNGGPSVVSRPYANWHEQTQRYYVWGTGIYADAQSGTPYSETLRRWLDAGGGHLCRQAANTLGIMR
ncbi:MAG: transglycosylase SLT domain-containing protein [Chloroflexi bacterium]|nr:transglycosylase SLT domain-containing protein [Chloroflexota bacterium]